MSDDKRFSGSRNLQNLDLVYCRQTHDMQLLSRMNRTKHTHQSRQHYLTKTVRN